jgi:hypothetical protein
LIEDYRSGVWNPTNNPNYHSPTDRLETLNLALCARITAAAMTAMVELADE